MGFPKFFTPNNDGYNDTWNLIGFNNQFTIYIYNRYGKLLKVIFITAVDWDGNFRGDKLPSDDYWFVAELIETNNSKYILKGHFSLVR